MSALRFDLDAELRECTNDRVREWVRTTYRDVSEDRAALEARLGSLTGQTALEDARYRLGLSARQYARAAYDVSWDKPGNWADGRPCGVDAVERLCRAQAAWCRRKLVGLRGLIASEGKLVTVDSVLARLEEEREGL